MLGIALVHAILMTIFVMDLVSRQRQFLHTQSGEQTEALARTLAANSVSWVLADDVMGLEEVVLSIKDYPNIKYAMILSKGKGPCAHKQYTGRLLHKRPNQLESFEWGCVGETACK